MFDHVAIGGGGVAGGSMSDDGLVLAEELLLLALDDKKGHDRTWSIESGLAGALLIELTEDGGLRLDEDERLVAEEGAAPDNALLAEVLETVRASEKPQGVEHWLGELPRGFGTLRDQVAQRLVDRGVLTEERTKLLGLTLSRRYPEAAPEPERALRARLRELLVDGAEPTPREAALVALLRPFELVRTVVEREERKEAERRAEEIAQSGPINDAIRRQLDGLTALFIA